MSGRRVSALIGRIALIRDRVGRLNAGDAVTHTTIGTPARAAQAQWHDRDDWRVAGGLVSCGTMPPLLHFQRVTVLRGGRPALREIDLRIEAGEHVALLGPNGSGKSSLIKAITRELYPLPSREVRSAFWGGSCGMCSS